MLIPSQLVTRCVQKNKPASISTDVYMEQHHSTVKAGGSKRKLREKMVQAREKSRRHEEEGEHRGLKKPTWTRKNTSPLNVPIAIGLQAMC